MTSPDYVPSRSARIPYPEAARALLRDSVLDAMRELLLERDWAKVTLTDIAARAGISRQTLYNEFGSRSGLSQAYAVRLADRLVDHVETAVWANVGDIRLALDAAFRGFLIDSASDPLVRSLQSGEAKPDLLRLVTVDSGPILTYASDRLTDVFQRSWLESSLEDARVVSRAVVRLAISYVSMPPETDRDLAADFTTLFSPFFEQL